VANRITAISIDCRDPEALARFWSAVLGWEVVEREDGFVSLGSATSALTLDLIQVAHDKAVKNRVHFDVNATDRDQAAELERLLALGARPVDIGQGDVSWHVLADPEGNEFCLLRRRVDPVADPA
jgi:catechol 2,3-dioxygenase-like lactoylglutathione lyase family enzyme